MIVLEGNSKASAYALKFIYPVGHNEMITWLIMWLPYFYTPHHAHWQKTQFSTMDSRFLLTLFLSLLNFLYTKAGVPPPYETTWSKAEVYSLPKLQYDYNGLEPFLDEATLHAHHEGHHEAYRKKMNTALQEWRRFVSDKNKFMVYFVKIF